MKISNILLVVFIICNFVFVFSMLIFYTPANEYTGSILFMCFLLSIFWWITFMSIHYKILLKRKKVKEKQRKKEWIEKWTQ